MVVWFFAGLHPGFGTWGIWLSKAGFDVTVAGPASNFILKPDLKYEQIVLSGQMVVGSGLSTTVMLPANLGLHPYVWLRGNINTNCDWPSDVGAVGNTSASREVNFQASIYTDRMIFGNGTDYTLYGFFIVYNRSIGA